MVDNQEDLYRLLKNKKIIAILDGDEKYGEIKVSDDDSIVIAMPYLNGPDLCALSTFFGLQVTYSWGGVNLSRWQYLDDLMDCYILANMS